MQLAATHEVLDEGRLGFKVERLGFKVERLGLKV